MSYSTALEGVLKRDRTVVLAGLAGVAGLAWAYLFYLAGDRGTMAMPSAQSWAAPDLLLLFIMWAVMMTAMMAPSTAPMLLLFAAVNRRRREQQRPFVATGVFLAGYLLVWAGFAAAATTAQWGLHAASLLSSMMEESTGSLLGGSLLLAAGVFQWSPLKRTCLSHCRSPLGFLMNDWREGTRGALRMGLRHGSYCLGCCWVLMSLLLVLGVMNLLWVAVLAAFVLVEKVAPAGHWIGRSTGLLLVAWGALMAAGALG